MKTVFIAGASGLVGQALLTQLLADRDVARVYASVRKPLPLQHAALTEWPLNVAAADLAGLGIDEAYLCLGTTIKTAGSQAAFKAVDVDLVVSFAQRLHAAGVQRCAVVSSLGASPRAGFYLRCKAQMEDAVTAVGFERTVFVRPSLLAGQRTELRMGERIALALAAVLRPMVPKKYRPVQARAVAAAMQRGLCQSGGQTVWVIENDAI